MKKLLITGASGFIGKALVDKLAKSGEWEIHAVAGVRRKADFPENVIHRQANLLDLSVIDELFALVKPEVVVHLAWQMTGAADRFSGLNISWLEASLHMLRAFESSGGRRFIFAGSSSEYGGYALLNAPPNFRGFKETDAATPECLYGECKNVFGNVASRFLDASGKEYAHARIFTVYGPGEIFPHAILAASESLMKGEPFVCLSPNNEWDFVFIEDAVLMLSYLVTDNFRGKINITGGSPIKMSDLFSLIAKETGGEDLLSFNNLEKPGKSLFGDPALMNGVFNHPRLTPVSEGIRQTIARLRGV